MNINHFCGFIIVAEHINEMQRIHEEYGAIFEHLARSHARTGNSTGTTLAINGLVDLSPTALMHVSILVLFLVWFLLLKRTLAFSFILLCELTITPPPFTCYKSSLTPTLFIKSLHVVPHLSARY